MAQRNVIAGLICLLLFFSGSLSGLMIETPLSDLVRRAAQIIEGEVLDLHSYWNDDRTMIYTDIEIAVQDRLKGVGIQGGKLIVRLPGGEVEGIGCRESDTPTFVTGERVLLFLRNLPVATGPESRRTGVKRFELVERAQGKFTLHEDGMAVSSGYTLADTFREGQNALPLSELRALISRYLSGESVR